MSACRTGLGSPMAYDMTGIMSDSLVRRHHQRSTTAMARPSLLRKTIPISTTVESQDKRELLPFEENTGRA